jgi:Flp pilus assembly protein TadD
VTCRGSVLLCAWLCACAGLRPVDQAPAFLFQDESFAAPVQRFRADDLFALSEPMRQFVADIRAHEWKSLGQAEALVRALHEKGQLRLEYDAAMTRTASEAFEARAGNCLSLVIMTAALAKKLELEVEYQSAMTKELWSRSGDLLLGSGHVNVTLSYGRINGVSPNYQWGKSALLVDFVPADEILGLPVREIPEQTIVAMYMNNRAVESLVLGKLDDAYGWARAAIRRSPGFPNSYNTLGVVYLRHGDMAQAERVFRFELQREPGDTTVMSNLADVLSRTGNEAQAAALRSRLARIDPNPPYYFFDLGMDAMRRNDFQTAKRLFAKEVYRADYNDEFHYWLGIAYLKLGDIDRARRQLLLAIERSQSRGGRDLYAAKLAWLQSHEHPRSDTPPPAVPAR